MAGSGSRPDRRGLGRGLSALMADVALDPGRDATSDSGRKIVDRRIPIEKLRANPDQPRRDFAQESLEDLARSIREKGVIQPLIVRPDPAMPDMFQIVAGERRWRAAQLAQVHDVPVILREFNDSEALEIAIIENIQRADLNAVEEALAYRQLMERFGHTQEKLADALGKSRSHIANALRLLGLPSDVLELLRAGKLSAGHARALVPTDAPSDLARQVIARGLSVRQTEALAKRSGVQGRDPRQGGPGIPSGKDADTRMIERDLHAALRLPVSIEHDAGKPSGRVVVHYRTLEEFDRLMERLSVHLPRDHV